MSSLDERGGVWRARVRGSLDYTVKLWTVKGKLQALCTCPLGRDRVFCKHCVAAGLAVLAGTTTPGTKRGRQPRLTLKDVRANLLQEEKEILVELLLEHALKDALLEKQLFLRAAKKGLGGDVDVESLLESFRRAIEIKDYVDWRAAGDYAAGLEEIVQTIRDIFKKGHASETIELTEQTVKMLDEFGEQVDDSDGFLGATFEQLQQLHLQACKKVRPDPVALARKLFAYELELIFDSFHGAVSTYSAVLGAEGRAEYRRLAEKEWKKLPRLSPGEQNPGGYASSHRITAIQNELAQMDGDVEAVARILQRDLSLPYGFLKLAELYQNAKRPELAIEWAEKGLAAFPKRPDGRLRQFLADAYHAQKRHTEAMELIWAEFTNRPNLEQYKTLKRHADRAKAWPAWREKCLTWIQRELAAKQKAAGGPRFRDRSLLVQVHLSEKDVEAAWSEAQAGGCSNDLWLTLADKRAAAHPQEVLPIYQRQVEVLLDHTSNEGYEGAIRFLEKVQRLMKAQGTPEQFSTYLEGVRAAHSRKRNFLKLLDKKKWAPNERSAGP